MNLLLIAVTLAGTGKWTWPPPHELPEPLRTIELAEEPCTPPKECAEKCMAANPQACVEAALGYATGEWQDTDNEKMGELYYKACSFGYAPACHTLGHIFWKGMRGLKRDEQASAGFFGRGCHVKHLPSCFNFAMMNWRGLGVAADDHAAEQLFEMLCNAPPAGDTRACVYLGMVVTPDDVSWAEAYRSAPIFEKACNAGDALGCTELGFLIENGMERSVDFARARALYTRGCDADIAEGCYRLARMLRTGRGGSRDTRRAANLAERACDRGHRLACGELAGLVAGKDPKRAAKLFGVACRERDADACAEGAKLHEAAGHEKLAFAMERSACDYGRLDACTRVGMRYESGRGTKKDYRFAVRNYERACAGKEGAACARLGAMVESGRGVDADPIAAIIHYQAGCGAEVNTADACARLAALQKKTRAAAERRWGAPKTKRGNRCGGGSLEQCLLRKDGFAELTLGEALLIAGGIKDPVTLDKYAQRLDAVAHVIGSEAKARAEKPIARADAVLRVMHALYLHTYDLGSSDLRVTLDTGKYNCVSATLLYILAGRAAGLPVSGYATHGHVLATVFTGAGPHFVETTAPGVPPQKTWNPPLPAELFDWKAWPEVRGKVRNLLEAAAMRQVGDDEAGADELWERARSTFFSWFFRTWAMRALLEESAYDVSHRALASLLYWNRSIDAARSGDAKRAALLIEGILRLAEKEMVKRTVHGGLAELRALLLNQGAKEGWAKAAQTADGLADALAKHPDAGSALRDLRAAVYLAWLRAPSGGRSSRCRIAALFAKKDPKHPVLESLRPHLKAWRCR